MTFYRTFYLMKNKQFMNATNEYLYKNVDSLKTNNIVGELEKRHLFSSGTRDALIKRLKESIIENEKMILWAKRHSQ